MDVLSNLQKLPEVCAVYHPETNLPVVIRRGVMGFHELVQPAGFSVEKFNAINGVSSAQQAAMLAGSIFGWDCPGADVDNPIHQEKVKSGAASVTRSSATVTTLPPADAETTDMARRLAPITGAQSK